MIKKLLPFICLAFVSSLYGQDLPNSNLTDDFGITSTSQTAVGKEVINVDQYTGKLEANFPVYEYNNKSTGLQQSIQISYKGGGVKVDDIASNIGLDWELVTGGVIKRQINGLPDEIGFSLENYPVDTVPNINVTHIKSYAEKELDGEYDDYYFSAGNFSGKFHIGTNGDIMVIPESNLKIERITQAFTPSGAPLDSCGGYLFKITTPDGNQYIYGSSDCTKLDFGDTLTAHQKIYASTTWYLKEVISAFNRDTILMNYTPVVVSYTTGISGLKYEMNVGTSTNPYYLSHTKISYPIQRIREMRLSNIQYPDGTEIDFNYDGFTRLDLPAEHALNNITITNGSSSYGYHFSYFYDGQTGRLPYKDYSSQYPQGKEQYCQLFLNGYDMFSGADTLKQYGYQYNDLLFGKFLTSHVDYWGYYSTNAYDRLGSAGVVQRSSSGDASGCLNKIYLPTGGNIRISYEPNHASFGYSGPQSVDFLIPDSLASEQNLFVTGDRTNHQDPSALAGQSVHCVLTITPTNNINNTWPTNFSGADLFTVELDHHGVGLNQWFPSHEITFDSTEFMTRATKVIEFDETASSDTSSYLYTVDTAPNNDPGFTLKWDYYTTRDSSATEWVSDTGTIVGGVRVKKIIESDSTEQQNQLVKEFKYVEDDGLTSSGQCSGYPTFAFNFQETYTPSSTNPDHPSAPYETPYDLVSHYVYPSAVSGTTYNLTGYTSAPEHSLLLAHGQPVGYTRVEEYDGSINHYDKKTVTTYSSLLGSINFQTLKFGYYPWCPQPDLDFMSGLPLSISTYNAAGLLMDKRINSYHIHTETGDNPFFRGIKVVISKFPESDNLNDYSYNNYYPYTGWALLTKSDYTEYYPNGDSISSSISYTYDTTRFVLKEKATTDAKGIADLTYYYYPFDFSAQGPISIMQSKGMIYRPLRTEEWKDTVSPKLVKSKVMTLQQLADNTVEPLSDYQLSVNEPVAAQTWGSFNNNSVLQNPQDFTNKKTLDAYDSKGNITDETVKALHYSIIWDAAKQHPIAEIANAVSSDVAYTSFEDGFDSWQLSGIQQIPVSGYTGLHGFALYNNSIYKTGLNANKTYLISFWATGTVPSVSVKSSGGITSSVNLTPSESHRGWTLYKAQFTNAVQVTIPSGANPVNIDEVRLYPQGASMVTYTYDPLYGKTSVCDPANHATYTEYDGFGRPVEKRDQDYHIIKTFEYQNQEVQN